ncbi:hypothetical protein C1645_820317 [Glomus cerebriforme]|uniref:Uncharacterized protein n=1 Tax=Glomus cerebriforme TaxID=658196 RepID=A0A397T3I1_9GLOM|nr:hypothetical protein C1645_820317 [Glomus cerebriforme]
MELLFHKLQNLHPSFCKILSIYNLMRLIEHHNTYSKNYFMTQEILKMFMRQIFSLKELTYDSDDEADHDDNGDNDSDFRDDADDNNDDYNISNFINFPGAKDCLKNFQN